MWINMKIQFYPQKVFVNPAVPAAASRGAAFMRSDASLHTGMKDSPRIVVFVGSAKSGMSKRQMRQTKDSQLYRNKHAVKIKRENDERVYLLSPDCDKSDARSAEVFNQRRRPSFIKGLRSGAAAHVNTASGSDTTPAFLLAAPAKTCTDHVNIISLQFQSGTYPSHPSINYLYKHPCRAFTLQPAIKHVFN